MESRGAEQSQQEILASLTDAEVDALVGAASWYASHQQASIRDSWDDRSAAEATRRAKFLALHDALRKFGVRRPSPAPLDDVVEI